MVHYLIGKLKIYHGGGAETPGECGQSSAAGSKHDYRLIGSLFASKMKKVVFLSRPGVS